MKKNRPESYRLLVENSLQGVAIIQDRRIVFCNNAYAEIRGYSIDELLSLPDSKELIHSEDQAIMVERYHNRLAGKPEPAHYELRIVRKDGTERWVEIYASLVEYKGKPAVQLVDVDITDRKRAEEALRHSEQRFSTVFHKSPMSIAITRLRNNCLLDVNNAWANTTGYTREQAIGHTPSELNLWADPVERDRLLELMHQHGTISGFEVKLRKKSGEFAYLLFSAEMIELGGDLCMLSMAQEITERKNMEQALRHRIELQDQLAKIAATVPGMIYSFQLKPDGSMCLPYASRISDDIFGLQPEDLKEDFSPAFALIRTDDIDHLRASIFESARTLKPWHYEFRVKHPSRGEIWVEGYSLPSRSADGSVLWHGFVHDITGYKLAREQLQRFVASSPALLYALGITANGLRLTWMSGNLSRIAGWENLDYARWKSWWIENIHVEDREMALASLPIPYEIDHQVLEYRFRREDGTYIWVRDERRLLRNIAGNPSEVIGTWVDISEQKRLEAQFRQAQKMEAVGALAGGVAHDFNNLLLVIKGYTELLLEETSPANPNHKDLELIEKACQQATLLTSQLLAFSRKQMLQPEILDLNEIIDETSSMLRRLIGEDINLMVTTQTDLGLIHADPGQLQQIILNLAINARDAMPEGGILSIKTEIVDFDEHYIKEHPEAKAGQYVMLAITDNGIGMDATTQARIFEPFFTTKGKGKGTGLGLSTVYGIVKQSNGFIWVYSEPEKGTTFKIYFPRVEGAVIKAVHEKPSAVGLQGSETVLVVEDAPFVRALAGRILREHGYTVLEASCGQDALDISRKHDGPIQLVLTDIVMPGMSGKELVDQLEVERPGIKSLYVSGYTDDAIVHHGVLDSDVNFLQKPFTIERLARKVRDVLGS
jgi:two-component system, cell cycle sensor histidine kinase and response regulator CckA